MTVLLIGIYQENQTIYLQSGLQINVIINICQHRTKKDVACLTISIYSVRITIIKYPDMRYFPDAADTPT